MDASLGAMEAIAAAMPTMPALNRLQAMFRLSPFERSIVLLCAATEFDGTIARLCATAQADVQRAYPTFGLALAVLPEAHWNALSPSASLRRWRFDRGREWSGAHA